jgi:hypothetical protein
MGMTYRALREIGDLGAGQSSCHQGKEDAEEVHFAGRSKIGTAVETETTGGETKTKRRRGRGNERRDGWRERRGREEEEEGEVREARLL